VIFGKSRRADCGDAKILIISLNNSNRGSHVAADARVLFYLSPTMSKSEPIDFSCPGCEAGYKVVTIEAPSDALYGKIACLKCDALFPAGEGRVFFKYLLVGRPSGRASRKSR
jgi:hypothetical protein